MKNTVLGVVLSLLIITSLILVACSSASSSTSTSRSSTALPATTPTQSSTSTAAKPTSTASTATPTPVVGGTLKIVSPTSIVNLGYPPGSFQAYDLFMAFPCVETLIRLDDKGLPKPWLATAWEISNDRTYIDLTLKQGIKFHDGTDFNADAVKYDLDLYRQAPGKTELTAVKSIDVLDANKVRLNLSQWDSGLLPNLAFYSGMIVSPTAIKTNGQQWCTSHPVGTGAFEFVSWTRDVSIKYQKSNNYWQKGKPYLDAIEFSIIKDSITALTSFKSGEGNAIIALDPQSASELQKTGNYSMAKTPAGTQGLAGDGSNSDSPFADINVRRAISYAIDNQAIAKTIGYGFLESTNQLASTSNWYYNPKIVGYPYNPSKAKEYLAKSAYPNGFETRILFQTGNVRWTDTYTAVQGYLAAVGIKAKLEPMDGGAITEMSAKGWKNGLFMSGGGVAVGSDPGRSLTIAASSKSEKSVSMFHTPVVDKKLLEAMAEVDNTKRIELYQELMHLIIDEYCMHNPIYVTTYVSANQPKAHDINIYTHWRDQWTPEDAWLSK
jgi:peptide/nickel transport system substrate-binding protein